MTHKYTEYTHNNYARTTQIYNARAAYKLINFNVFYSHKYLSRWILLIPIFFSSRLFFIFLWLLPAEPKVRTANRICRPGCTESARGLQRWWQFAGSAGWSIGWPCIRRPAHSTITGHTTVAGTTGGYVSSGACHRPTTASAATDVTANAAAAAKCFANN